MPAKRSATASAKDSTATIGFVRGGAYVQSAGFIKTKIGKIGDIYSQVSWRAAETDGVKWARRHRPFGLAMRARRARLRRRPVVTLLCFGCCLAVTSLALCSIEADFCLKSADTLRDVRSQLNVALRKGRGTRAIDSTVTLDAVSKSPFIFSAGIVSREHGDARCFSSFTRAPLRSVHDQKTLPLF